MWPHESDSTDLEQQFFSADDEVFVGRQALGWPSSPIGDAEAPVLGGSYSWSDEHEAPSGDDNELCSVEQEGVCGNRRVAATTRCHFWQCATQRADAPASPPTPALALLLQPVVKGKRKRSAESFGELVLVPKQPAAAPLHPAAGWKVAHGTKQAVKSGYRGVRQRPWGA